MGKALRIFVVLNLLLAAAVIGLGFMAFQERQILKTRTVALEENIESLAEELGWGMEVAWETEGEQKTGTFSLPPTASADELSRLDETLSNLATFATQRYAQLNQRYTELVQTRQNLSDTKETLADRERDRQRANDNLAQLNRNLGTTKENLVTANRTVDDLQSKKSDLQTRIQSLNEEMTQKYNRVATLEVDLDTRIQQRDLAQKQYQECQVGAAGEQGDEKGLRGLTATILAVNPQWEYVVLDKGADANISTEAEAYVHRDKKYVGKLQVVRVEDDMAVAEIVPGSLAEDARIRPGDRIFF